MPFSRRHHRARTESRSLPAPEQLELPFEWKELAFAYRTRNPSRWIDRLAQPSPSRPATRRAKRAQTYIAPASSFLDNIKEKVRQGHPFWLTSPISANMVDVIQKGWRLRGPTLPSLGSGKEPELSSGRPHVGRGSRRSLQTNPLERHERRAGLPALRLPRRLHATRPARCSSARRVSINSASRPGRSSPAASSRSGHPSGHRDLRERRQRP